MKNDNEFTIYAGLCNIYSALYYAKPTEEFVGLLRKQIVADEWPVYSNRQQDCLSKLKVSFSQETVEDLNVDFFNLFLGGGQYRAYPWSSIYTQNEKLLYGDSAVAFAHFCKSNNIKVETGIKEPQDHIGIIFFVLGQLLDRAAETGNTQAINTLLEGHLLPWFDKFIDAVSQKAKTVYFKEMSAMALDLIINLARELQQQQLLDASRS